MFIHMCEKNYDPAKYIDVHNFLVWKMKNIRKIT